jgi:multidrug efflux pump subunit AcrA (membrane-fusion protein)
MAVPETIPAHDRPAHGQRPAHPSHRTLWVALFLLVIVAAAVGIGGYLPRERRTAAAEADAKRERDSLPVVIGALVRESDPTSELALPGNIASVREASIYARASGYVQKRFVDFGDQVKEGQLMAVIEAPELDQQVAQGRASVAQAEQQLGQTKAALVQAKANLELARVTWDRYKAVLAKGAISKQDGDQALTAFQTAEAVVRSSEANVGAAEESVRAAKANLDRLVTMQEFEKVRAPIAGVVTVRNVDTGSFISTTGASSAGSPGPAGAGNPAPGEMFRVAQIGTVRLLINVPQTNAPDIYVGQPAQVLLQEFPGQVFAGKVTRTSNALDPATRTLLTEVQVSNPKRLLLPGMFAQVKLESKRSSAPLLVPGDTLMATPNGLMIAVLVPVADEPGAPKDRKRVHLQPVQVGRDYGAETEVLTGLQANQLVVVNPGDAVKEGALVTAHLTSAASGTHARQGKPAAQAAPTPQGKTTP